MELTGNITKRLTSLYFELERGIDKKTRIDAGWLTNNFAIVSNGRKYFLKCYRFKDDSRIRDIHAVKFFFASHGIPVILPIFTKGNKTTVKINSRYISLFPFVEGVNSDGMKENPHAIESLGRMLGRIHKIGKKEYPRISKRFRPWDKSGFHKRADTLLKIIDSKKKKDDFDIESKRIILLKKSLVEEHKILYEDFKNLRIGLIHGDYHDYNVFFSRKGEITHVFDFEKTSIAPFAFEIIRSIQYSKILEYGRSKEAIQLFLEGYKRERNLSENELKEGREVFYQEQIHNLWVEEEHYFNKNSRVDKLIHTPKYLEEIAKEKVFNS